MVRLPRRKKAETEDNPFAEEERAAQAADGGAAASGRTGSIVPASSVAGRALTVVVAIMTLLSCLTIGVVSLVTSAAGDWQSEIARELSIQIRPIDGQEMLPRLEQAVRIAEAAPGVRAARALSKSDNDALLEPWLGEGLSLDALPVPRLVVVTISDPRQLDTAALKARLEAEVPGASLDDHTMWSGQLASVARSVIFTGGAVVALMLTALAFSIVFATRAAIASNIQVIEVLHFVGAENSFVAREFQKHFLLKGFVGGLIGGGVALVLFVALEIVAGSARGTVAVAQAQALLGPLAIGYEGYVATLGIVFAVAILTAVSSRIAVYRHLTRLD
ncbi:cell division protein FtsX [Amorphus orientalis]|uniref:Cell division transport system permease protein n=1 Tax=Amorphus orientalis TaxID=649198 RepID=A0AAE4AUF8_9HYPH|nr:ABC transporter permease [Amorphus orientalis]MDQ0317097.1 cell division transport system permease protein [Amorphus orientalis]